MIRKSLLPVAGCLLLSAFHATADPETESVPVWTVSAPFFQAGKEGTFDDLAVKDPSVVRYRGRYHFFKFCGLPVPSIPILIPWIRETAS